MAGESAKESQQVRRTFKERDKVYEALVAGLTLPGLDDDSVLWLKRDMLFVDVEHNDLGRVAVEVRQILNLIRRACMDSSKRSP